MRAPRNETTGTSGETEVLAQFQRLGWAALLDSRHDTGTDLYLRPRDSRRYELGAMMGAQVKTGPSYFSTPEKDASNSTVGWWYAENDRKHFDGWLSHALPHILILRDQSTDYSFWVHITPENVISTGKGAKILVPLSQTVDSDHNEALSDVALTQLPSPMWDGTAWTGAVHLSPEDEIRYALITPRLIAPHPNLTPDSISGVEALAMQVLFRTEIKNILEGAPFSVFSKEASDGTWQGFSFRDALGSDDWCWQATVALYFWHHQGQPDRLLQLAGLASTASQRAAASVIACKYYFDTHNPDSIVRIIEDALNHDDYSPVDHAWLETQLARALLEVGREEEAFDLAMKNQRIYRETPSDVTAAAIAGACAQTSFSAAGWMRGDVANIIQRRDNPASWWRSQLLASGLSYHLDDDFRSWSSDQTTRISISPTPGRHLRAVASLASFAGDHQAWCGAVSTLARHLIITNLPTEEPAEVASHLTLLRMSGDKENTGRATRRIINYGPTKAARIASRKVNLSLSTRMSAWSDLEFLTVTGDVLDPEQADEVSNWALATLRDPKPYLIRTRPTFILFDRIIDLLKALVWTVSESSLHNIIDYFLNQPPITDDAGAQKLAQLIHKIPKTAWRPTDRQRAGKRSKDDGAYLNEAFLAVAAGAISESREEIFRRARAGELIIFEAIDDVRALPSDAVETLSEKLRNVVEILLDQSLKGIHSFGGIDVGKALTLLGIWHPSSGQWSHIDALIQGPQVSSRHKYGALRVLAVHGHSLADEVKTGLLKSLTEVRGRKPRPQFLEEDVLLQSLTTEAMAALTDEEHREQLVRELLSGDSVSRTSSARIIKRLGDRTENEIFLALSSDPNEHVREAALNGLSNLVWAERAGEGTVPILSEALLSGGKRSAIAIVSSLQCDSTSAAVSELLNIAAQHPSAQVRRMAKGQSTY